MEKHGVDKYFQCCMVARSNIAEFPVPQANLLASLSRPVHTTFFKQIGGTDGAVVPCRSALAFRVYAERGCRARMYLTRCRNSSFSMFGTSPVVSPSIEMTLCTNGLVSAFLSRGIRCCSRNEDPLTVQPGIARANGEVDSVEATLPETWLKTRRTR